MSGTISAHTGRDALANASQPVRVAILGASTGLLDDFATYITANSAALVVVLRAASWGELVASEEFPTRVVFLDADAAETVSLEARIRACRATGAVVVAVAATAPLDADSHRTLTIVESAGARGLVSPTESFAGMIDLVCGLGDSTPRAAEGRWRPMPGTIQRAVIQGEFPKRPKLSRGEAEALALYASGKTLAQVASVMNVQFETARTFLRRVREKYAQLGRTGSNRAELTRYATEDGFLN